MKEKLKAILLNGFKYRGLDAWADAILELFEENRTSISHWGLIQLPAHEPEVLAAKKRIEKLLHPVVLTESVNLIV